MLRARREETAEILSDSNPGTKREHLLVGNESLCFGERQGLAPELPKSRDCDLAPERLRSPGAQQASVATRHS